MCARGLLILGLLLLVNILNFVDRLLPSILVGGIRKDLGLSDAQIGLMAGVAFAVIYSFAGVAMARIADLRSPRLVISLSLAFWSLATALSGLAQGFWQLFMARAGVAAGEAGCTPAAHALIARVFPTERRSLAVALFSLGVPIGGTLGLILGGWINDAAQLARGVLRGRAAGTRGCRDSSACSFPILLISRRNTHARTAWAAP